jgi:prepilin peptidase dependent protein B
MLKCKPRAMRGLTLIELMLAILLSTVVVLGGMNLYLSVVQSCADVCERNNLNDELRSLMGLMVRDIRRAGAWGIDVDPDNPANVWDNDNAVWANPFMTEELDLQVGAMTGQPENTCILFAYDYNSDGAVGEMDAFSPFNERFGFRLNGAVLEAYDGGTAFSCDEGSWVTVNSPLIRVDRLQFVLTETCIYTPLDPENPVDPANPDSLINRESVDCELASVEYLQSVRRVAIDLEGSLSDRPEARAILHSSVKVRNDKVVVFDDGE